MTATLNEKTPTEQARTERAPTETARTWTAARDERGSGSVLVIIAISIVLAVTAGVAALSAGFQARHDAAAAADLAALGAAERLRAGDPEPCAAARAISAANRANLVDCAVHDRTVDVAVRSVPPEGPRLGLDWARGPVERARAGVEPSPEPTAEPAAAPAAEPGWRWPVPSHTGVSAVFGQRGSHWASGRHTGLDVPAAVGTAVVAAAGGSVSRAGRAGAYGNLVVLDHGGTSTYYAHLSGIAVRVGQAVAAGEVIGRVGATGNVTGPHLHFELRIGGVPHDPRSVF